MKKYAYIVYLPSNDSIENIIGMYYSFKKTLSIYPFYTMCANNISQKALDRLTDYGIQYIIIPEQYQYIDQLNNEKNITYVFNLTQFDKIICTNKNSIFTQNMDQVFDYPDFPFFWEWSDLPNTKKIKTNWFSCVPNEQIFNSIMQCYNTIKPINNEEALYKVLEKTTIYSKTIITFPAFVKYFYCLQYDDTSMQNKTNKEIEKYIDDILNDTYTIADFKYKYYRYVEMVESKKNKMQSLALRKEWF